MHEPYILLLGASKVPWYLQFTPSPFNDSFVFVSICEWYVVTEKQTLIAGCRALCPTGLFELLWNIRALKAGNYNYQLCYYCRLRWCPSSAVPSPQRMESWPHSASVPTSSMVKTGTSLWLWPSSMKLDWLKTRPECPSRFERSQSLCLNIFVSLGKSTLVLKSSAGHNICVLVNKTVLGCNKI